MNEKGFNEQLDGMLEASISEGKEEMVMSTLKDVMSNYEPASQEQTLEDSLMEEENKKHRINEHGIVELDAPLQHSSGLYKIKCVQCTESIYFLDKTPKGWEDEQCPECKQLKVS